MATWLYDMITMIIYVHRSFHSREDILPSLSHSGLVTLTNVTARMAPASLAIEDSSPPIVSTLNSPPQSSVTSEQTDNHLPPTTTAPEQAFPEYQNGNITIQLRAHEHDDFMSTGWATSYSSHWKVVVKPDSINVWELWCVQQMVVLLLFVPNRSNLIGQNNYPHYVKHITQVSNTSSVSVR